MASVLKFVIPDEPEYGDPPGGWEQLTCPECESEEFHLFSGPHVECAACGTEIDLETLLQNDPGVV